MNCRCDFAYFWRIKIKYDYNIKLKSNGKIFNSIELLANTNYHAKKEVLRDIRKDKYYFQNSTTIELYCDDNKLIKIYKLGETK